MIIPYRDHLDALWAVSAASEAWWQAYLSGRRGEALDKLSREDDRLRAAYMKALFAPAWPVEAQVAKKEETPVAPAPVSALPVHGEERTGRVSSYDAEAQYGYIVSRGESFYFQTRHLQHAIAAGDTVTFLVWYMTAGAKPRATRISKPGYVAPKNAAVERAQAEARANADRETRRKAILEAGRANRQSALKPA